MKTQTKMKALFVTILWAVAACGSSPGGELVSITQEPPGANCPNGGQKVETGVDANGNGKLDSNEVTSTSYACNGTNATNGKNGQTSLTQTKALMSGDANCPDGGVEIDTGIDTNGNGKLDASEVTSTQYVCNGANGTAGTNGQTSLTSTTALSSGDANCPTGGVEIDTGLDTNGNGTLDASEITSTQYVCNGPTPFPVKSIDPPASPAGAFAIDATGGVGTTGAGGRGGRFQEEFQFGTFGGHAKVFSTGQADASFAFPSVTTYLGDSPATISSSTIIAVTSNPTTAGELHTRVNDQHLYLFDGTQDTQVTGLSIAAGATVTFQPNVSGTVQLTFQDDVDNAGTITTAGTSGPVNLTITAETYLGEAGSAIDVDGAFGGASTAGASLALTLSGGYYNQGDIDAAGADSDDGFAGGAVTVAAQQNLISTGAITTTGGSGGAGTGGSGGTVTLSVSFGQLDNAGAIDASGGDGTTAGGVAGAVTMTAGKSPSSAQTAASLLNSGDISANGGSVTDGACVPSPTVTCGGGQGNELILAAQGGKLVTSGNLSARGGSSQSGPGGNASQVFFRDTSGTSLSGEPVGGGDIVVSGNLVTAGGDGAAGGVGGPVFALSSDKVAAHSQEIIFEGYTDIHLDGGDGATSGGDAGAFLLLNNSSASSGGVSGPSGGAINYAAVTATGGSGQAGGGGRGGAIAFSTEQQFGAMTQGEVALNFGDIDARGGVGATGGAGGSLKMTGNSRAENHAAIHLGGGASTADAATGGAAGSARMSSGTGSVLNAGSIDASGGAATTNATGGAGGAISLTGNTSATSSGSLATAGGDADATSGTGGAAADVTISSDTAGGASNTGTIQVPGGAGATNGAHGEVFIGGQNVTATFFP